MKLTQEQKDRNLKEIQEKSNEDLLSDYAFLHHSTGEYGGSDEFESWQKQGMQEEILKRMNNKTKNHDTKK